ncbi:MAG: uroporphyrinogen decarboxylase family protein, partial [Elusimicrobiota bacterium]|nr:uroporphyrinogen decarboxylase family protein [Elusimicrobiota bacterium]
CIGDDMGTQSQPFMSIEDFRKHIKPYWAELIKEIKKYTEAKILLHCCGSIYPLINDIIEVGFDVLNPIQPLAHQMEPKRLKKDFGDRISFLGGIDIQRLLPFGTPDEVKQGVRKVIGTLAPGGGYILAPSHNIEPDTPPENVVAMYEAAKEFGTYPIKGS